MTPNVGALLVILIGLICVYVAIKGSQAAFFGAVFGSKTGTSSTSSPAAAPSPPASGSSSGAFV